jgi:hypothetical protein
MQFIDYLNKTFLVSDIPILETGMTDTMKLIVDKIKKLLDIDIVDLFRLAHVGGDMTGESVIINDLWVDVIVEDMDNISLQTVVQGNKLKILEVSMSKDITIFKGYIIAKLDASNDKIIAYLKSKMVEWDQTKPLPFRWFKSLEDASKELEANERKLSGEILKKPELKTSNKSSNESSIDANKVAAAMAEHIGRPQIAAQILKFNKDDFIKAASIGKEEVKRMSLWSVAKTIFLGYLALSTLATGIQGLAALVIGYLAVVGIDAMRNTTSNPIAPIVPKLKRRKVTQKATAHDIAVERFKQFKQSGQPTKLENLYRDSI